MTVLPGRLCYFDDSFSIASINANVISHLQTWTKLETICIWQATNLMKLLQIISITCIFE